MSKIIRIGPDIQASPDPKEHECGNCHSIVKFSAEDVDWIPQQNKWIPFDFACTCPVCGCSLNVNDIWTNNELPPVGSPAPDIIYLIFNREGSSISDYYFLSKEDADKWLEAEDYNRVRLSIKKMWLDPARAKEHHNL